MYVLGPARLDPDRQILWIGSQELALQRKPFLVLLYLVENRQRMVDRKELLERFWDGKEVYDQSLSKAIGSIRKAFGESRTSSKFIETRWASGYRYVGPFEQLSQSPLETAAPGNDPEGLNSSERLDNPSKREAAESLHTPSATASRRFPPSQLATYMVIAGFLAVALGAIGFVRFLGVKHAKASSAIVSGSTRSVAVLPFASESHSEEDQYLGLGLADAVAARLGTASQLSVRSSSTVRSILGSNLDNHLAAQKLEVQALVSGKFRRENGKLIINVELRNGASEAVIWSGSFNTDNSDSTNIFATEDSIARQASQALLPQLGLNAIPRSHGPDTTSSEAYTRFMKAKFFAGVRTQNSIAKAIELLNEAIRIDPNYARAYAVMADCYQLQGFYGFVPPSEAYPRARQAAQKALSIDNSIVEAHATLISILADYYWDWKGVEQEFKATVSIDSNYAVAYQYYAYALLGMARSDEAVVNMERAAVLDPVSPSIQTSLAWAYFLSRKDERAVDQCRRVLELYPDFVPAHQLLGIVYGQMRADQRAVAELKEAESLERDSTITPVLLEYEVARSGKRADAAKYLESLMARSKPADVPDYYLAAAWTAVGDKRKALASLQHAIAVRSNWVIYLQLDPRFDDLRNEPQFRALLLKITPSPIA